MEGHSKDTDRHLEFLGKRMELYSFHESITSHKVTCPAAVKREKAIGGTLCHMPSFFHAQLQSTTFPKLNSSLRARPSQNLAYFQAVSWPATQDNLIPRKLPGLIGWLRLPVNLTPFPGMPQEEVRWGLPQHLPISVVFRESSTNPYLSH